MASDDLDYDRVIRRITRIIAALAGGGAVAAFLLGGWSWAAGFILGGAVSWLSFRWLKQMVGAAGTNRPPANLALKAVLRYLLIGGVAYAILKYAFINLRAAVVGLLVSTAAVLVEIVIELVHAKG